MQQHLLKPPEKSKKRRKRVGRGDGSGHGSYSGRGQKGQKARSGPGVRPGFEGGQLPIIKALPMIRGFTNIFKIEYSEVNLDKLARFPANSEVTPDALVEARLIKNTKQPVKILGRGALDVPLMVQASKFSRSAREKIQAAGGSVMEVG